MILQSGQWKFTLLKDNEYRYYLQIPHKGKYDVTHFLNYFDFTPKEFRKDYLPEIGKFEPITTKKEELPSKRKEIIDLESELLLTSKDSGNPKNFEVALEKFFQEIGFSAKRIGGPGETDVLVFEPIQFIVDGKSTKAGSKSSINFTRIKRHMKENHAEFMLIISVGFDPAVARDAEIEGATLIDINTLITILKIHRENILSPFDYIPIFKHPGIVNNDRVKLLQENVIYQENKINNVMLLLDNLDFTDRNIDEIKGRVDLYCEQNSILSISKEEMENLLIFLSNDLLGIVKKKNDKFSMKYKTLSSKEKLKLFIKRLCEKDIQPTAAFE